MAYLIIGASADVSISYIRKLEEKKEPEVVYAHYNKSYESLNQLSKELKFVKMHLVQADLSKDEEVENMLNEIKQSRDEITHIIHAAASKLEYVRFKELDLEKMRKEMQIQVYSFVRILKELLPRMAKQKYGRVVALISSATLGKVPSFMSDYVTIKYALTGLIKSLASEYIKKGITINGISPNMMKTKFLDNIDERTIEIVEKDAAMGRNINLSEVVDAIYFLMSDEASYITGVNMNLSGGDYM